MSDKVIPVRVGVRIRPMSEKEEDEGCQQIAQVGHAVIRADRKSQVRLCLGFYS